MGFSRKRKRAQVLIKLVLSLVFVSFLIYAGYKVYVITFKTTVETYQAQITALEDQDQQLKKNFWIPMSNVSKGSVLEQENFTEFTYKAEMDTSQFMDESDFGKIALCDLPSGEPVMKSSLLKEDVSDDVREEEFNMFFLATNLITGDVIDLRIQFTNGEDYIVLAKKRIRDINLGNNTLWIWLNEEEMNRISSAIVDAYLHKGTKLYTVTYVEPSIQEASKVTYPVNLSVREVMASNPNILAEAKNALAQEPRESLNERLNRISEEDAKDMANNITEDSNQRQQILEDEKELVQETDSEESIDNNGKDESENNDDTYFQD